MTRSLVKMALAAACVAFVVQPGWADAPARSVKASFKVYDKERKVVADVSRAIPKHTNAFDALRRTLSVDFDTYPGLGNFVTGIMGIRQSPGDNLYWVLYVDGAPSQLGIGNFYIEKDTLVEFKLETPRQPAVKAGQKIAVLSQVQDHEGKVLRKHKVEFTVRKSLPLQKQE